MDETTQLVKAVKNISISIQNPVDKSVNKEFSDLKSIFEKSLSINKDLKAGDVIRFSDLETKKPKGFGILASEYEKVIGKEINKDLLQWDFLNYKDLIE
jgi:N-acetylneuraminate synthase